MKSANATEATASLRNAFLFSNITPPTERIFLLVRDFSFVKLACHNGLRTATLYNFKLHLNGAIKDSNGNIVYKVPKHKTAASYEASEITMMADVHELFLGYVKLMRVAAPNNCQLHDLVFITSPFFVANWAGQITATTISNALTNQFKSIRYEYRVTTSKIRKLVATNVKAKFCKTQTPQRAI